MGCGASSGTVKEKEQGKSPEGGGTPGGGDGAGEGGATTMGGGASTTAGVLPPTAAVEKAAEAFQGDHKWGRKPFLDKSANSDWNTLVKVENKLVGPMPQTSEHWSTLLKDKNQSVGDGFIALLLKRASDFASSSGGMLPACLCLHMAYRLTMEINKGMREDEQRRSIIATLGSEKMTGATLANKSSVAARWKKTIKEIRKKLKAVPSAQRKGVPLFYIDAILSQIEVAVAALPDPDAKKNALFAVFKIVKGVALSAATMKVDADLVSNLCAGINMAVEKRIQINAERTLMELYALQMHKVELTKEMVALANGTCTYDKFSKVVRRAREMQSVFDLDSSPPVGACIAKCLAEVLIGTNRHNCTHLSKEGILFLVLGELKREDGLSSRPEFLTDVSQEADESPFMGLAGLAGFGLDDTASGHGASCVLLMKNFMKEKLEDIIFHGEKLNLSEIVMELHSMIEPEVLAALQEAVARGREVVEACAEEKLVEIEQAFEHAIGSWFVRFDPQDSAKERGGSIDRMGRVVVEDGLVRMGGRTDETWEQKVAAALGRKRVIGRFIQGYTSNTPQEGLENAVNNAKELNERLKAGLKFLDTLVSLLERSVGTALVLVDSAIKMLKLLVKAFTCVPGDGKIVDGIVEEMMDKKNKEKTYVSNGLKKIALASLRPKLQLRLKKDGVLWKEFVDVIDSITVVMLKECADRGNIEPIMKELEKASAPIAIKILAGNLQPKLKAQLKAAVKLDGAAWEDVASVISASDITFEDVQQCVETQNIEPIVSKLTHASEPVTKKIAIATLRPKLEPLLKQIFEGAAWEDTVPALEAITVDILKECAGTGNIERIMEELTQGSGPLAEVLHKPAATVAGARMGTDAIDLGGAHASEEAVSNDAEASTDLPKDLRTALVSGANCGQDVNSRDGARASETQDCPVVDSRDSILDCLVALTHVQSTLKSVRDVVRAAKSIQQEAVTVVKAGDDLVKGLSSLGKAKQTRRASAVTSTQTDKLDAAKGEKLVKELTMLSQFVREKVVGMAVCIDDSSGIFGSAMMILKCSTPVIIDLGQNDDSLNLPSKITVRAAGVTDPLAENLEYVSSCSNFKLSPYPSASSETVVTGLKWINSGATRPTEGRDLVALQDKTEFTQEEWDEFGVKDLGKALQDKTEFTQEEWDAFGIKDLGSDDYIKCGDSYYKPAAVVGWILRHVKQEIPDLILFSGPDHGDGLAPGQWKVHAFNDKCKPRGAETSFRVPRSITDQGITIDAIKKKMEEEVKDVLSKANFALLDALHEVCKETEQWAREQMAAAEDAAGITFDEVEESVGALAACFEPVKALIGSVFKSAFARQEAWRTRAIVIYLLLQLLTALEEGPGDGGDIGDLAPQARTELAKVVRKVLTERKAFETDGRVRKAFDAKACAVEEARFRLASWKDPSVETSEKLDEVERLECEIKRAQDPEVKKELEDTLKKARKDLLKNGAEDMMPMLQLKMESRMIQMIQMQEDISKALAKDTTELGDWEESEETVHKALRQRMDALTELREKMEEETEQGQKQHMFIECRREQVAIRQQLRNVEGIGQSLGIIIGFLGDMQSQLTSINSKLDKVSADVQRLENRVAGRPPEEQIRMFLQDMEEQIDTIPDEVFVNTECLGRCEHVNNGGFKCSKCETVFTESSKNKSQELLPIMAEFLGGGERGCSAFQYIRRRQAGGEGKEAAAQAGTVAGSLWELSSLLIHGPAGSGKSSFAKETRKFVLHYCHYMLDVHGITVIPVFVNLPVMTNPLTELFEEALRRHYGLRDSQIFELKDKIRDPAAKMMVVFFLDGYDELKPEIRSHNLFKTNNMEMFRPRTIVDADKASSGEDTPTVTRADALKRQYNHQPKLITFCRSEYVAEEKDGKYQQQFLPMESVNDKKNREDKAAKYFAEYKLSPFNKKVGLYIRRRVAIEVRKMFETVFGKFLKPKPGHDVLIKSILLQALKSSIAKYEGEESQQNVAQSKVKVLSPSEIEEVRLSICLATQGGSVMLEDKDKNTEARKDENSDDREYDMKIATFFKSRRQNSFSRNAGFEDMNENFDDSDGDNKAHLLAIIRLLRRIQQGIRASDTASDDQISAVQSDADADADEVKVLGKLSDAEVWSVPRTWFRLQKVKGLEDLKDTPFLIRLILRILAQLNEMAASPSTVKQNLFLLCSSEDEAEMAASRLQRENITSTSKQLEEFQQLLSKDGSACMSRLENIAKEVENDLISKIERDGLAQQKRAFDKSRFVRNLLSALQRRSLSRSTVFGVFTEKYIEAQARDKQASASTRLRLEQLQREVLLYCLRLATTMTKESRPKVEYANASVVFTDSTDPFFEFFANGSSDASVLELVQRCSPLTISQEVCSFMHKSLQEYFAALGILKHLATLCGSCRSEDKRILNVLGLLNTTSSDVRIPAGLDSKEKEEHMMRVVEDTSWGTGCKVADRTRMSQDLLKLVLGIKDSALCMLDIEQEEGVRDFLLDLLLSTPAYQNALILIARLCASQIGSAFEMARENIWTLLTMANPKREGGSLLHVACREGNLPLLRTALSIMKDCYRKRLWHASTPGAKWENVGSEKPKTGTVIEHEALAAALTRQMEFTEEELNAMQVRNVVNDQSYIKVGDVYMKAVALLVSPLLLRGASKFRTIPIVAAALHGHRDCVEEILRFVEGVSGLQWENCGAGKPPQGRELKCPELEAKLRSGKTQFTPPEWDAFDISSVRISDFIRAGDSYFQPAATGSEASEHNALQDHKSATEVKALLQQAPFMEEWKRQVYSLDWSKYRLDDADAQMVAQVLECLPGLGKLDLSGNSIGAPGCLSLGKKLAFAESLQLLDMSENPIGADGCQFLVQPQEVGKLQEVAEELAVDMSIVGLNKEPFRQEFLEDYGSALDGSYDLKGLYEELWAHYESISQKEKEFDLEEQMYRFSLTALKRAHFFTGFDTDRNDAISETEFLAFFRRKFGRDDIDHLAEEAQVTVEKLLQKLQGLSVDGDDGNQTNTARMINAFRGLDHNKNGVLSLQEFVPLLETMMAIEEEEASMKKQAQAGLGGAVSLQELNLSGCGVGPEGSREVAAVLDRLPALARLHIHDALGEEVQGTTIGPADGHVVVKGCLVPLPDTQEGEQAMLELNLRRLHAHVPSLLAECKKAERAKTPDREEAATRLESRLEQALSLSYCAAKAAAGVSIDLLQELSDATDAFPQSKTLRERKTLVSRSRAFVHTRTGREAARCMLQLAFQEPVPTGLPAQVQALRWEDLEQGVPRRDGSPAQSGLLIEYVNCPEQQSDDVLLTIAEHTQQVNCAKVLPGGKLLASASDDGDVLICSMATGEVKCTLAGHNDKGLHGCICVRQDVKGGVANEDCPLLREATGGHVGGVTCLDVSRTGKLLVTGGTDRTVRVWKREGRSSRYTLWKQSSPEHAKDVRSVSIHGRRIASGSADGTVKVWAPTGRGAGLSCQQTLTGHTDTVTGVYFDPTGKKIVSCSRDKTIRFWDSATGAAIGSPVNVDAGKYGVLSVSFSPKGDMVAAGCYNGKMYFVDPTAGEIKSSLRGHDREVLSVSWSPDGTQLASGGVDSTVRLWDASTGAPIGSPLTGHTGGVMGVSFDPTGKKIVSCSQDKTIRFWDSATGAAIGSPVSGHSDRVRSVSWSPDGTKVVSGSNDETVRIWEVATGKELSQLNVDESVSSIDFAPCGNKLAAAFNIYQYGSFKEGGVKIFSNQGPAGFVCQSTLNVDGSVSSIDFAPCGNKLAAAFNIYDQWGCLKEGGVKIFSNQGSAGFVCQSTLSGHSSWVRSVSWSPDGTKVASGSDDETVRIWEVATAAQPASGVLC